MQTNCRTPSRAALVLLLICIGSAGCAPRGTPSVKSDDPSLKIPAIQADARDGNHQDLPELVKSLEDDDPAIRFYAIEALRQITGDNFGFIYYADEDARKPAVQRWKRWLKAQGATPVN